MFYYRRVQSLPPCAFVLLSAVSAINWQNKSKSQTRPMRCNAQFHVERVQNNIMTAWYAAMTASPPPVPSFSIRKCTTAIRDVVIPYYIVNRVRT